MTIEYKDGTLMNLFILTQIMEWCYTGTLDFKSLSICDVMVIMKAAKALDIPHLEFICDQYIHSELTVDSSFIIIKQAKLLEMNNIKDMAYHFAFDKWSQFAAHKGGMDIIGIEIFQDLTINMNNRANLPKPPPMTLVKNELVSDFKTICDDQRFTNGEIVVEGDESTVFKFHKVILAAYSKPFFNLISTQPKGKSFTLSGLSKDAVSDLLSFIYYGKEDLDPVGSCQIIEHAMTQYSLHDIRETASNSISKGITCDNAVGILRLTYLPQSKHRSMVKLREKVLQFICDNFKKVPIPSIRELEHSNFGHNLMADILETFFYRENPDAKKLYEKSTLLTEPRRSTFNHDDTVTPPTTGRKQRSQT